MRKILITILLFLAFVSKADASDYIQKSAIGYVVAQNATGWTDDGTVVRLTTSTDNVVIGANSSIYSSPLVVEGSGGITIHGDQPICHLRSRLDNNFAWRFFNVAANKIWVLYMLASTSDVAPNGFLFEHYDGTKYILNFLIKADGTVVVNPAANATSDLRVRGDTEPYLLFTDASTDQVGIGTASPQRLLHLFREATANTGLLTIEVINNDNASGPTNNFWRARGTSALKAVPSDGDIIGAWNFDAWDTSDYNSVAHISGRADGTISLGSTPGRLLFATTPSGSTSASQRMMIYSDGSIVINEGGVSTADVRIEGDTDSALFFTDSSADSIGIGTSTPTGKLDIQTDGASSILKNTAYGTGFAPDFTGRMARGTQAAPTATLSGDTLFSLHGVGYDGSNWTNNKATIQFFADENFTPTNQGTYIAFLTTATGGITRTEKVRITSVGDVGIGTNIPSEKLHVKGTATTFGTLVAVEETDSAKSAGWVYNTGGVARGRVTGIKSTGAVNNEGDLVFETRPVSPGELTERLRIGSDGSITINDTGVSTADVRMEGDTNANLFFLDASTDRVGIGTSSPQFPFHVISEDGPAIVPEIYSGSPDVAVTYANIIARSARGTQASPAALKTDDIIFAVSGRGYDGTQWTPLGRAIINGNAAEDWTNSATGTYIVFRTVPIGSTTVAERMRILDNGNVGIGDSTPDYKLDVNGTFGFTPGTSVTPVDNGDVVIEATNNTTLTFKLRGSDGVIRSGTLTLS